MKLSVNQNMTMITLLTIETDHISHQSKMLWQASSFVNCLFTILHRKFLFWHTTLRLHSAKFRKQSPEWSTVP